ncbi:hypothetical protein RvY_15132 [Ramazzottius varieornatus]|uniref:Uncharacterized protein n=1 Tax=Ramazzottius varieornatus TaxID=947166 RepID=A0A1D1VTT9_RAMVA|nr:hypothetical protein RvY_15132 [Ramazzottius varieornatus]
MQRDSGKSCVQGIRHITRVSIECMPWTVPTRSAPLCLLSPVSPSIAFCANNTEQVLPTFPLSSTVAGGAAAVLSAAAAHSIGRRLAQAQMNER